MNEYEVFQRILGSSKEFSFEGSVLVLKHYYTGETVKLDLSLLDQETFESLKPEEEPEDDEW